MTWVKIDDGFPEHHKILGLSDAAFRLHIHAMCYAARNLTDGLVHYTWLTGGKCRKVPKAVTQLVERGIWREDGADYQIHDYLTYQPSRVHVLAGRAEAAARMQRARNVRVNINGTSREVTSTPSRPHPVPSPTPKEQEPRSPDGALRERFDRFWASYPRRIGKGAALRMWNRLKPDEALTVLIIAALEQQAQWPQWTKDGGQFIPHPSTWLHQERWTDEATQELAVVDYDKFRPKGA